MQSTLLSFVIATLFATAASAHHTKIFMSAELTEIDGNDSWEISFDTNFGDIEGFDFTATPGLGGFINETDPLLNTQFLFTPTASLIDTSERLSNIVIHRYVTGDPFARLVVPAGEFVDIEVEFAIDDYMYGSLGGEVTDLDIDDAINLTFHPVYRSFCERRAGVADFNCDLETTLLDLDILGENFEVPRCLALGCEPQYYEGDANGDGAVTLLDLDILGRYFEQEPPAAEGDHNGDGIVSLLDLDIVTANYGHETYPYANGDASGTGIVDLSDLIITERNMEIIIGPWGSTFVPEPASLAVLSVVTLGFIRRR